MAVPYDQSVILPLLHFTAAQGGEVSTTEAAKALARELHLTAANLRQILPSGISPPLAPPCGLEREMHANES